MPRARAYVGDALRCRILDVHAATRSASRKCAMTLRDIRAHAWRVYQREDMAGMRAADRKADNATNAEYMSAYRLGKRVEDGARNATGARSGRNARGEYLLARNRAARLARENPTQRALITLPTGRAENACADWREALRKRTLPAFALRLCDDAQHGSARGTDKREGRERARKAHTRKAARCNARAIARRAHAAAVLDARCESVT